MTSELSSCAACKLVLTSDLHASNKLLLSLAFWHRDRVQDTSTHHFWGCNSNYLIKGNALYFKLHSSCLSRNWNTSISTVSGKIFPLYTKSPGTTVISAPVSTTKSVVNPLTFPGIVPLVKVTATQSKCFDFSPGLRFKFLALLLPLEPPSLFLFLGQSGLCGLAYYNSSTQSCLIVMSAGLGVVKVCGQVVHTLFTTPRPALITIADSY